MYPGPEFPQLQFAKGPGRTGRTPFQRFAGNEVHARGRLRQEGCELDFPGPGATLVPLEGHKAKTRGCEEGSSGCAKGVN